MSIISSEDEEEMPELECIEDRADTKTSESGGKESKESKESEESSKDDAMTTKINNEKDELRYLIRSGYLCMIMTLL